MAKNKVEYVCQQCGRKAPKALGKCPQCGSWNSMVAEIVAPHGLKDQGHVYTVEMIPELANFARENLERTGYNNRVSVISGDGSEGYQDKALYDKISVTAASPQVPHPLLSQLERGGLMVIPVGSVYSYQTLMIIRKDLEGRTTGESRGGCAFVPLKGKYGQ